MVGGAALLLVVLGLLAQSSGGGDGSSTPSNANPGAAQPQNAQEFAALLASDTQGSVSNVPSDAQIYPGVLGIAPDVQVDVTFPNSSPSDHSVNFTTALVIDQFPDAQSATTYANGVVTDASPFTANQTAAEIGAKANAFEYKYVLCTQQRIVVFIPSGAPASATGAATGVSGCEMHEGPAAQ